MDSPSARRQAAVFLLAASGLMLEVALTRIFSATIWYHYAFLAISVALLGWGLGGLALHALGRAGLLSGSTRSLAAISLAAALSIPLSLRVIVVLPFAPERLAIYFAASVVPFFLAGAALAMALALFRSSTSRLYFADLCGAAAGTLAVALLLAALGGERAVLAVALLPALAALLFAIGESRPLAFLSGAAFSGLAVLLFFPAGFEIKSAPSKGLYQHVAEDPSRRHIARTRWNSFSRIDAVEGFASPYLARLYIDSDAWTNVLEWDGKIESLADHRSWFRYLPYRLVPKPKTLVIGPGGGADVLLGIAAESPSITAVEMNPIMLDFVRGYGARAGNLYDQPTVRTILADGRNFIRRSEEKFDLILLGFVDSWASVSSGGLSLTENYLYTVDAFRDYYDHLTDRGVLAFIRWQVDVPRMVTNTAAMLGSAAEAGAHVAVLMEKPPRADEPVAMIFLLRKTAFTPEEARDLESWTAGNHRIHVPGRGTEAPYAELFSGALSLEKFYDRFDTLVEPVTDDRPFYFATDKPLGVPRMLTTLLELLLLPLLLFLGLIAWSTLRVEKDRGAAAAALGNFTCLGVGFIMIELTLLQRLILLLGQPIFTLTVLLFSLLVSSALGSLASGRARGGSLRSWLGLACGAAAALGLVYAFALPSVVRALLPLPLLARIGAAGAMVFPLGFAMGIPFPTGLRAAADVGMASGPPLFFGLNGVASVAGSLLAVAAGMILGFGPAMAIGAGFYALAALLGRRMALGGEAPARRAITEN